MKKTISMLAILAAASSASAMIGPNQPETQTVCLQTYKTADGSLYAASCDSSRNNKSEELKLKKNGCAKGQVALSVEKGSVHSCLPAGAVQL